MHGQRLSTDYADNHRKLILCALNRNNTEGARQIFHEMPGSARNETMTRYLVYKVALQSGDHDLAADCLERIGAGAAQDPNYLYACVLDAQRARDKICAGQAMKQLLERHEFNEDSPIHLPALLRSNIRIAVAAVEGEKSSARNACIEDVAGLFEQGMHFFSIGVGATDVVKLPKQSKETPRTRKEIVCLQSRSWTGFARTLTTLA